LGVDEIDLSEKTSILARTHFTEVHKNRPQDLAQKSMERVLLRIQLIGTITAITYLGVLPRRRSGPGGRQGPAAPERPSLLGRCSCPDAQQQFP
jgi:hypothetical protein